MQAFGDPLPQVSTRAPEPADALAGIEETFPLSPIQAGMLFHTLVAGGAGVEIEQIVYQLPELISVPELAAAWNGAIAEHTALRTRISHRGLPEPVQEVLAHVRIDLRLEDWSSASKEERDRRLARWLEEDRTRGIDLSVAPMMRLTLFRFAPAEHVLLWTFHHVILDGRSMETVLESVFRRYDASLAGTAYAPPPRRAFRDHVAAVRALDTAAQAAHFRAYLEGFSEPTPLPLAAPARPGRARHREVNALLGKETVARLEALGRERGSTLANAICAAWALVLGTHARRDDVLFGVTRACRHAVPDGDSIVGCLINTLPLRVRLDERLTVTELCVALREEALAIRPFETTALSSIREVASVDTHRPLFETFVMYERQLLDASLKARGGAFARRTATLLAESAVPLALACYGAEGDLLVEIEYREDRFTTSQACALRDRVVCLLRRFAEAPDATLAELDRLLPGEAEALAALEERPPSSASSSNATTLVDLVDESARAHPARPAITEIDGGRTLTHAELAAAVDAMAAGLRVLGVGDGDRVVLACARSLEAITAMLAVQRVGAAYVPVDPSYPDSRIALVVEDARPRLVVADHDVLPRLPQLAPHVDVRAISGGELGSARPRAPRPAAETPAYVVYTSGSTGRPKGVVVPHRAVVSHARSSIETYGLEETDRVLQFASLSFDISVEEVFPTLAAGAALFLRSSAMATSMATLMAEIAKHEITVVQLPTSFFHELVPHLEGGGSIPEALRLVIVGGERASPSAYERFAALAPGVRWVNAYGPTEATVTATSSEPRPGSREAGADIPIGRPFGRSRVYLLDPRGRRVPRGAPGEIVIGGPQVALGYLGDPEKTRSRFFPDPTDPARGPVYATGDLGQWNEAGELEFLGRIDEQVKIRGFRVEPGETEAALACLPEVEAAVVAARPDAAGELSLIAWVTLRSPCDPLALRERLLGLVPAHVVPSRIIVLDELPIGPGGKIDKSALPTPAPLEKRSVTLPSSPLEEKMLAIFRDVLALPSIDVEDDFFEVGGHSLRAVRLMSRLADELGKPVGLAALYESPTVRGLARAIESGRASGDDGTLVPLVRGRPDRAPVVCVCGVHLYETLARAIGGERTVYGLFVPVEERGVRAGAPLRTEDLAAAYVTAIRRTLGDGPVAVLGVSFGGIVAYEMAQQMRQSGQGALLVMLDSLLTPMLTHSGGPLERALHALDSVRREPLAVLRRAMEKLPGGARTARAPGEAARGDVEDIIAARDAAFQAALEAYEPVMAPLPTEAALFVSRDRDPLAVPEVTRLWRELLAPTSLIVEVSGDHLGILREPGVHQIARELEPLLARLDVPFTQS